ncbi:MAG: D-alanine--D-alanine ligase [Crocinitomicaceae bacterium]|nr:D-alanine--D-alanine ligase [Crocinitomicaceae bacterium]
MKKVAVIEGGYSKEKAISIKSAKTVFDNLDRNKFEPTRVLIDENEWTAYDKEGRYSIDKNDFSFSKNGSKVQFEYAFIVIHGTPGEDGKLQGYLDMVGIPYNTSTAAIMALTFQKFHCNQFLKSFGINVPEAVLIKPDDEINEKEILKKVNLACFVKPTDGGSSYGVTKVKKENDLLSAITAAFKHGTEVVVEQSIEGREVTCGVYRDIEVIKALPITEIISENEYFDYDAKYNGKSQEITPADLDEQMTNNIKDLTKEIYDILAMRGIARMDYIINKEGAPFLIEINSIPGMSNESIVPQMLKAKGILLHKLLT